jgi:hypothetical protein
MLFNILLSTLTPSIDEVICNKQILCIPLRLMKVQGGSNMTGTDLCVNRPHTSRSYLNHLVHESSGHCISLFIDYEKACDSGDNYSAIH